MKRVKCGDYLEPVEVALTWVCEYCQRTVYIDKAGKRAEVPEGCLYVGWWEIGYPWEEVGK